MGQNIYGSKLQPVLEYLNNNVNFKQGAGKKYKTEEDYYNAFVEGGSLTAGRRFYPSDELRRRLWKRAQERYKQDYINPTIKSNTIEEMIEDIHKKGVAYFQSSYHGKDQKRMAMMKEAVDVYFKQKKDNS